MIDGGFDGIEGDEPMPSEKLQISFSTYVIRIFI
jgi:hypothetical protein